MVSNISQIVYQLFQKEMLEDVSERELRYFVKQYPFSGTAHLLLAKKLQLAGEKRALERETAVAALYFSNPAWLQFVLSGDRPENTAPSNPTFFVEHTDSGNTNLLIPEYNEEPVNQDLNNQNAVIASGTEYPEPIVVPGLEISNHQAGNSSEATAAFIPAKPGDAESGDAESGDAGPGEVKSGDAESENSKNASDKLVSFSDQAVSSTDQVVSFGDTELPSGDTKLSSGDESHASNEEVVSSHDTTISSTEELSSPTNSVATEDATHFIQTNTSEKEKELLVAEIEAEAVTEQQAFQELPSELLIEAEQTTSTVGSINSDASVESSVADSSGTDSSGADQSAADSSGTDQSVADSSGADQSTNRPGPTLEPEPSKVESVVPAELTPATQLVAASVSSTNSPDALPKLEFDPYHTIDYFASQGIKLRLEDYSRDKLGQQLKSFTEWIRSMKRLPQQQSENSMNESDQHSIRKIAEHSVEEKEVLTESMAEVWSKQGNYEKARQIYRKLSLQNPSKSTYFAAKIEQLKVL